MTPPLRALGATVLLLASAAGCARRPALLSDALRQGALASTPFGGFRVLKDEVRPGRKHVFRTLVAEDADGATAVRIELLEGVTPDLAERWIRERAQSLQSLVRPFDDVYPGMDPSQWPSHEAPKPRRVEDVNGYPAYELTVGEKFSYIGRNNRRVLIGYAYCAKRESVAQFDLSYSTGTFDLPRALAAARALTCRPD
jgi:hypothetical protein